MSVSQFWLLVIGVQASTSRMPYLTNEQVWSGSPSRCCGTCESEGTAAESHSRWMASPRSWTDFPTVLAHGAPGDSQSNGFVERPIRSAEDMIRTHKQALENKIGEVLKVDTAVMAWMIEHCADIVNKERMAGGSTRGCAECSSVDPCWSSGRR